MPMFGMKAGSNSELAMFISNPKGKPGKLIGFNLFTGKLGYLKTPCRIRIYLNEFDKPGREITEKNIIIYPYAHWQWNHFDLEKTNLVFPKDGCFVSLEWLNMNNPEHNYTLNKIDKNAWLSPSIVLDIEKRETPKLIYARYNEGIWEIKHSLVWNNLRLGMPAPLFHVNVIF